MSKDQALKLLMLLSALESWSFSAKQPIPDYLHERLSECQDALAKQVLEETK